MPGKIREKGRMTPEAVERVCRLNVCLIKAADWIEDRAGRTQAAYFAGGGKSGWIPAEDGLQEDYELQAVVKCLLGNDAQEFNPDDEHASVIAVIEPFVRKLKDSRTDSDDFSAYNWNEGLPDKEAFRQTRFCYLFHDIYAHALHLDIDSLLRIGELEINLALCRQRGITLDARLLPGKRLASYPRSVFSRTPQPMKRVPLSRRELRYAVLLNQEMGKAGAWIHDQARRSEKEYADMGGIDRRLTEDNAYEDYEIMLNVCGCLGENHPEHDEDDDNIIVSYDAPLYKKDQYVFGRARNPFRRYGAYFTPRDHWALRCERGKIQPCWLFWDIFTKLDYDWLKMLSIGKLWLDVYFMQRRIIQMERYVRYPADA